MVSDLPNDSVESTGQIPMILEENLGEGVVLRRTVVQSLERDFGIVPQLHEAPN